MEHTFRSPRIIDGARSISELLRRRADCHGDRIAVEFLADGETNPQSWTYGQLDQQASDAATRILDRAQVGDRALLIFPSGLDFIAAFFGCLYAGVTAVPAYPPRRRGNLEGLGRIASDCGASLVLSTRDLIRENEAALQSSATFPDCPWQAVDGSEEGRREAFSPSIEQGPPAFLQYTSGSTGNPKGVAVSHENLLQNQKAIHAIFRQEFDATVMVGWLPMYHDMGLVGNLLHPLYMGGKLVFMPPTAFLQKPLRWLEMITRYRATISGGPNFAYSLCLDRTDAEDRARLDLTSWQVAFNGAEPLRAQTLREFEQAFAPHGFSDKAFCPCFGMAETTLMVSGSQPGDPWQSLSVDPEALRLNQIRETDPALADHFTTLVSSGTIPADVDLRIVDPATRQIATEDRVGEIWIKSPSVAQGYWGRPELTREIFGATIDGDPFDTNYLRTGDLGCLYHGQLYVTGRAKDLIIVNGVNYYPQDLEATIEASHPDLSPGNGVAFAIERNGIEQVFVAIEISRAAWRSFDRSSIVTEAFRALWDEHQLTLDALLLVKPGGLPKTTSGKLQRRLTRQMFEEGTLPELARWQREVDGSPFQPQIANPKADRAHPQQERSIRELRDWLQNRVGELAGIDPATVSTRQPLAGYGLKSIGIVRLTGELSKRLDRDLAPTLAFDYPTIDSLCDYLINGYTKQQVSCVKSSSEQEDPIAVVGMACRFPGADSISSFQDLLFQGRCSIGRLPVDRRRRLDDRGAFVDGIDLFDPLFFSISPREAQELDPQQRLMLEVCWEAFEHAGMSQSRLAEHVAGVFVGVSGNEYARSMAQADRPVNGYTAAGNSLAMIANRVSYTFDLNGPSLTVDTACSSSLVAVHLAAESLHRGECNLAVVGGVSLMSAPDITEALGEAGMLSPGGSSRAFAAGADGFVRGEGCGAVLLKRLSQAVQDRDPIFAVLKGSAVNQDGRSNGLTAPNGNAQQAVIRAALTRAALAPDDIDYLEAHGTGTELGDPIEMNAVSAVFCPRSSPLHVGSVKTNIGHLEGAAGIAGLIKTCLALHHRQRPAHLHWYKPSPHIDWRPEIVIPTTLTPWTQEQDRVRRAGVSSFGFGGTNAHVVLEEAPVPVISEETRPPWSWMKLSAKTSEALDALADRYAEALESGSLASTGLDEIVSAANAGRSDFTHRRAVRVGTREDLIATLRSRKGADDLLEGESRRPLQTGWIFPPMTEVEALAESLATAYPKFRRCWDDVQTQLGSLPGRSALGCGFQLALSRLWRSFGIAPAAVQGWGSGRFAAAATAGVLAFDEALRLAALADRVGSDPEAADRYRQALAELPRREPQCLWFSGRSGDPASIAQELAAPDEVSSEGRSTSTMERAVDRPLLIVGPPSVDGSTARGLAMVGNGGSELTTLGSNLMHLYVRGADLDWTAVQGTDRGFVALPSYPFQRQRCWFQEPERMTSRQPAGKRASERFTLLGERLDVAGSTLVFETDLSRFPALADHHLHGRSVFPAVGYLELATAAGRAAFADAVEVGDLRLEQALRWEPSKNARVQVVLEPQTEGEYVCRIFSQRAETGWQRHAECRLIRLPAEVAKPETPWTPQGSERSISEHYEQCEREGLHYAGSFRSLVSLRADKAGAWGEVQRIVCDCEQSGDALSPGMLDGCLQAIAPLLLPTGLWLPTAIGRYVRYVESGPIENLRVEARLDDVQDEQVRTFQLRIFDRQGRTIAEIENLSVRLVSTSQRLNQADAICHEEIWEPRVRVEERSAPPSLSADEVAKHVRGRCEALVEETGYAIDLSARGCLDELSALWAINAMRDVLGPLVIGARLGEQGLADHAGIAPEKRKLFRRLLDILTEEKYLSRQVDGWRLERSLDRRDAQVETDRALKAHPRLASEILLLGRCGEKLSDVLRGDEDPLPILFSDKSAGSATDVYTRAAGARVLNGLLAEAVATLSRDLPPGRALRILEIGAGTGATTRYLLDRLPSDRIRYVFTDIARSFLSAAQEEFGDRRGMTFSRLDIEANPAEQGFAPESFDVIIAANVLHATAQLNKTLENVEEMLAPGGRLLLLEGTHAVRWMDLTFGLTESWWRFADADADRNHALVSPSQWRSLLHRQGFTAVDVVSPNPDQGEDAENVLLIAAKDAQVRQTDPTDRFLIFSLDAAAGRSLSRGLEAEGAACRRVDAADDLHELLRAEGPRPEIVFVNATPVEAMSPAEATEVAANSLLKVIQACIANAASTSDDEAKIRFTLVNCGTRRTGLSDNLAPLSDSAPRALVRTLALEQPGIRCRSIDVDLQEERCWEGVAQELLSPDLEPEVAIRQGTRYVRRLRARPSIDGRPTTRVLRVGQRGNLDALAFERIAQRELEPHEIEIEVRSAGLNFRDVLNLLGKYPEEVPLGAECSGVVSRVGSGVDTFAEGDAVIALAADCMAESVIVPEVAVVKMPTAFDFATAAALPIAYLTAAVALESIADVQAGQRVLIHAATGGVGIAAVELAMARGAEVYVTASLPKHSFLYGRGLTRVYDSRSAGFADRISAETEGRGVDVVLNLLDESFTEENLRALARGGRYVDITKPSPELVDRVRELRPDVEYHCFDLAKMLRDDPKILRQSLEALLDRVASGALPTLPVRSFSLDSAKRAFRTMQQARHIGKLVLCPTRSQPSRSRPVSIRCDGAYVVVGGLGDLGLISARILAKRNAGMIALLGRSDPDPSQQAAVDSLRADGAVVLVLKADASDREQLARALETVRKHLPIKGVIHSAGVLSDALIQDQSEGTFAPVFAAKVHAAWHLHELTESDPIELFASYSSIASILGAPGQSNHAAANGFLDGLAEYRLSRGLPATCINWGPWSEVGEAARRGVDKRNDLRGVGMISPEIGEHVLSRLLALTDLRVVVAPLAVESFSPRLRDSTFFEEFRRSESDSRREEVGLRDQLLQLPESSQYDWVVDQVTTSLVRVLGMGSDESLSPVTALRDVGLDSLTSIEFTDALNRSWGTNLQPSVVYDFPTTGAIARYLLKIIGRSLDLEPTELPAGSEADSKALLHPKAIEEPAIDPLPAPPDHADPNSSIPSSTELEQGLSKLLAELHQWKS